MSIAPDLPWHRLHPLSPVIQLGRSAAALIFVLAVPYISSSGHPKSGDYFDLGIVVLAALGGLISWLVTRWRIESGALLVETGLIRRRHTHLPLSRIQSVDVVRPALARLFGLAEVRVRTGVARDGDARLAYIAEEQAETIRANLLAWSHGTAPQEVVYQESVLAAVSARRVIAAVWLQGAAPLLLALALAFAVVGILAPTRAAHASLTGTGLVWLLLSLVAVLKNLNSQLSYEVAQAPDGLRVRGGLIGTVVETIPQRRIQAVRLLEPLLWRPMGWVRLDVDVAGGQHRKGEDRAAAGQLRMLLPVATMEEAHALLLLIAPDSRVDRASPPTRVRLKAPLSFHFLEAGHSKTWAVAVTGRIQRTTTLVSLAKVQSVRWSAGPLQHRMGLANVHLDVAGHRVGVSLKDRDAHEARELVETLPELCALARRPGGVVVPNLADQGPEPSLRWSSAPRASGLE